MVMAMLCQAMIQDSPTDPGRLGGCYQERAPEEALIPSALASSFICRLPSTFAQGLVVN